MILTHHHRFHHSIVRNGLIYDVAVSSWWMFLLWMMMMTMTTTMMTMMMIGTVSSLSFRKGPSQTTSFRIPTRSPFLSFLSHGRSGATQPNNPVLFLGTQRRCCSSDTASRRRSGNLQEDINPDNNRPKDHQEDHHHQHHHQPPSSFHNTKSKCQGVTLKMAFDRQGGVADQSQQEASERFTCEESLDLVHRLRRDSDAVLVGRSTVVTDDCTLTVRRVPLRLASHRRPPQQPTRIILDPYLRLDRNKYKVFQDGFTTLVYHCTSNNTINATSDTIPAKGNAMDENDKTNTNNTISTIHWNYIPPRKDPTLGIFYLSPRDVIEHVKANYDIHHVMVEGGPTTARWFLKEQLVDRAILITAPLCFKEPLLSNLSSADFIRAGLEWIGTSTVGVDTVQYWSRPNLPWPADPYTNWP